MSENYKRKALIKLKEGSFLDLLCEQQYIMSGKPYVAIVSTAINSLISRGKAEWLGELDESASQEEFEKIWKKSEENQEKAVAAFMKSFGKNRKIESASTGNTNSSSRGNSNQQ